MSNISTIYDAYVTICAAELPTYAKIPNPYNIADNSSVYHRQGYAIGYGSGFNTNRQLSCQYSENREFTVTLVTQVTAAITDFTAFNAIAKNLFEDRYKIVKAIEKDATLNTGQTSTRWVNDPGIEFLETDKAKYFMIRAVFQSEFFENLNA